jgi:transmembrane sensor
MSTDRLHYLLDSYAGGSCTQEEIQELHELLQGDWTNMRLSQQAPGVDWEKMYKELMVSIEGSGGDELGVPVRRLTHKWWYAAAAVLVVAISTAVVVSLSNNSKAKPIAVVQNDVAPGGNRAVLTLANGQRIILDSAHTGMLAQQGNAQIIKTDSGRLAYTVVQGGAVGIVYNTLATPRGGQFMIRLPDGTNVWLNSASSIRYPTAFTGGERKVEITGEAYFEVAGDKAKPFQVKAGDMNVLVLGTHFNINAYADEGAVATTLLEGSVKVGSGNDKSAILKPDQQALVASSNGQPITVVNHADIDQVVAWKNGYFSFNQADLRTVLRQLERWYDIDVKYPDAMPVRHFKGELSRDLTLSQVISVLGEMDVKFRLEGRTLTVVQ